MNKKIRLMFKSIYSPTILLMLLAITICSTVEKSSTTDFKTTEDHRMALNYYIERARSSKNEQEESKYLHLLFKAFPEDFVTLFRITYKGSREDFFYTIGSHGYRFSNNPWSKFYPIEVIVRSEQEIPTPPEPSGDFIKLAAKHSISLGTLQRSAIIEQVFFETYGDLLEKMRCIITEKLFYKKMLSVGMGGFWDSDSIGFFQKYLNSLVSRNKVLTTEILSSHEDAEVAGLFFFLFDGPHPGHPYKKKAYHNLYEELEKLNPRIALLLKKSYAKLLSESHCPGH